MLKAVETFHYCVFQSEIYNDFNIIITHYNNNNNNNNNIYILFIQA